MGETIKLRKCPDCAVDPGQPHLINCDVERCSACGDQKFGCSCKKHDRLFARWTGVWPGALETKALNVDLNEFYIQGYNEIFFIKPKGD